MHAGRVKHHLTNNIENPNNTFLIVGYCSPETPGGMLKNGVETIKLFGEWKQVNAKIETMDSFSAHGDRNEMSDFISNQKGKLKRLYLVHGEYDVQKEFKSFLHDKGFTDIQIPAEGTIHKITE
jgi:metallo-beta-lactamase family protein